MESTRAARIAGSRFQSRQVSDAGVVGDAGLCCAEPAAGEPTTPRSVPAADPDAGSGRTVICRLTRTRGENGLWSAATNSTVTKCLPLEARITVDGLHALLVTRPSRAMW